MFTFCRLPRHTVENNVNTNDLYLVAVVEKNKHKGQSISVRVLYHKQKKHFFLEKQDSITQSLNETSQRLHPSPHPAAARPRQ
jgi:alpha/beta superfamily hydrolase